MSAVTNVGIHGTGWTVVLIKGNHLLSQCKGIWRLLDQWDDAEPGPGGSAVPDVAGEVIISDNLPGCNSIEEILAQVDISRLNAGLNDAWYNPDTDDQGFFINVFPDLDAVSLAWFTYDTDPPGSDGTILLTFSSCNSGTVEYDIPSINRHGIVPIQHVANDNISLCEALNGD